MKLVLVLTIALLFGLTPEVRVYGQSTVRVEQHSVRFSAAAGGELLRVRVSTPDGQEVFDSGSTAASVIDWNRPDRFGLATGNGIYFAEVTLRGAAGEVSRTTMDVNLSENPAEALQSEAGTVGKLAKWITSTTLGNSVITESSAKIGIGSSSPTAVLHVSGSQPAPQAGPGTDADRVFQVLGGKGGNTTGGGIAGRGGSVYIGSGPGGDQSGTGGDILIVPGGPRRGNLLLAPSGGKVFIGTGNPTSPSRFTVRTDSNEWAMRVHAPIGSGIYVFAGGLLGYALYADSPGGADTFAGIFGGNVGISGNVGIGGDVDISGTLTKGSGAFKIDHPMDPANKYLSHSFIESPDMMNIYNGVQTLNENGAATVELPEWFETLNREFRYQLTCIGGFAPIYVAAEIKDNRFQIAGGTPGLKVSWQVTGIRQDAYAKAHPIQVVEDKPAQERGLYLHPTVFGYGEEKGISRAPRKKPGNYSEATSSLVLGAGAAASSSVVE